MQIQAYGQSDVGRVREINEDCFFIDAKLGLYIVCDGMGGHAAGEVASATATEAIASYLQQNKQEIVACDGSQEALSRVANALNNAVIHGSKTVFDVAASDRGKHGMGTTCVVLLAVGNKGFMANVGDSRLYLARDRDLYQLSVDHNFANEVVAQGMMSVDQARSSPHSHVLTRAVGTQPSVCADLLTFDILEGDTFLLCSDGLHEYTRDAAELHALMQLEGLSTIPDNLVRLALEGGGHDNITAVIVRAVSAQPAEQARKTSITRGLGTMREIELFKDLTMAEAVKVYGLLETVELAANQTVIEEGDPSDHLFIIVDGEVSVAREGKRLATLGPGLHFGEMALLSQRPRSATVTTNTAAELLRLSREDFHSLMQHDPSISSKFLWKFARGLSLRLDDAYLARDVRGDGRATMTLGQYPVPDDKK